MTAAHDDESPRRPCPDTLEAWARLLRASQRLLRNVERDLKEAGFPPLSWYDVLRELDAAGAGSSLRQFEIEERVAMTQYNLSRLLDRLEQKGLVRREGCPDDRRANFVAPTDCGLRLKCEMWEVYERSIARHFARSVAPSDARRLAAVLKPLAEER